jgi:uncharacterized membrane protein
MTARHGERAARQEKETGRVDAFSDGVFAIAITLLILDVKVPHLGVDASERALLAELARQWKSYVAYLMSFAVILVMWVNHHRIFTLVRATDQPILFWNGLLLMCISIVPFPTSLLAEYSMTPAAKTGAAVYAGHGVLISLAFQGLWRHALRNRQLLMPGTAEMMAHLTARYRFGPLMYVAAFGAAFVSASLSIGMCLGFALFFAILGFRRS